MPKIDQGDEGVEHRWVDVAGGLRVHVAEAGEGPPLLLLHGWPQHWWMWREVIPALARSHRVICADLRGHGWTDAPRSGYAKERLASHVIARPVSSTAASWSRTPPRSSAGPTGGSARVSRSSCSTEPTTLSSR